MSNEQVSRMSTTHERATKHFASSAIHVVILIEIVVIGSNPNLSTYRHPDSQMNKFQGCQRRTKEQQNISQVQLFMLSSSSKSWSSVRIPISRPTDTPFSPLYSTAVHILVSNGTSRRPTTSCT